MRYDMLSYWCSDSRLYYVKFKMIFIKNIREESTGNFLFIRDSANVQGAYFHFQTLT